MYVWKPCSKKALPKVRKPFHTQIPLPATITYEKPYTISWRNCFLHLQFTCNVEPVSIRIGWQPPPWSGSRPSSRPAPRKRTAVVGIASNRTTSAPRPSSAWGSPPAWGASPNQPLSAWGAPSTRGTSSARWSPSTLGASSTGGARSACWAVAGTALTGGSAKLAASGPFAAGWLHAHPQS